jgi:pyruvate kinase
MQHPIPKTKIVCTIGPASATREMIKSLVQSGMNVARLNFSHGTQAEHREKIRIIREVSDELNIPVSILQDLAGPKIRVGPIPESGIRLEPGQHFILSTRDMIGTPEKVSVSYSRLPTEVKEGDRILLADGFMELVVESIENQEIHCQVITGGILTSHKGINLPTGSIQAPSMTEKDKRDLVFGLENHVDYVALSFVRRAEDILKVKEIIKQQKKDTPVIAKIEKHEAISNIDEIMDIADGIMVARGDLGVETPLEKVPSIQKMLIKKANLMGKPVITATQMLRSMIDSPRPTRAEATDVANAVLDGTDAVMLSEETAIGNYPLNSVLFMSRIIKSAEDDFPYLEYLQLIPQKAISQSVAHATCVIANHLDAAAIIASTKSGRTAMHISRFRPLQPIIALSPNQITVRRLTLFWGCIPRIIIEAGDTDTIIENAAETVQALGFVSKDDLVVITAGHPIQEAGMTNMVRVKTI